MIFNNRYATVQKFEFFFSLLQHHLQEQGQDEVSNQETLQQERDIAVNFISLF